MRKVLVIILLLLAGVSFGQTGEALKELLLVPQIAMHYVLLL